MATTNATTSTDRPTLQPLPNPAAQSSLVQSYPGQAFRVQSEISRCRTASPRPDENDGTRADDLDTRLQDLVDCLLESAPLRALTRRVYCAVSDGTIRLFGAVHRRDTSRQIEDAVRRGVGTDAIENDIRVLGAHSSD